MSPETFSTHDIPVAKRARVYQDTMNHLFSLGLQINPDEQEPFDMRMTAYSSALLRFAAFRFSPHSTTRRVIADSGVQTYFLLGLQKEGKTTVVQDGREAAVEPGDLFMVDTGRPFHLKTGAIQTNSIYIPANQLREVFAQADALTAVRIRGDSGAGAMLRGMVDELFELAPSLDDATADSYFDGDSSCARNGAELACTYCRGNPAAPRALPQGSHPPLRAHEPP